MQSQLKKSSQFQSAAFTGVPALLTLFFFSVENNRLSCTLHTEPALGTRFRDAAAAEGTAFTFSG